MQIDPDELIPSNETAKALHVEAQTLVTWRTRGEGPDFIKIGRAVYYRRADIAEWLGNQLRKPTAAR